MMKSVTISSRARIVSGRGGGWSPKAWRADFTVVGGLDSGRAWGVGGRGTFGLEIQLAFVSGSAGPWLCHSAATFW